MSFICPKDPTHASTDPDFCSECGAKIAVASPPDPVSPSTGVGSTAGVCPDCGTPRVGSAKFCEVCRYNFDNPAANSSAQVATVPAVTAPAVPIAPVIPNFATEKFDVVVRVDPTLYTDPDPALPLPTNQAEQFFPLDLPENLIGRRSESRGIYPEISLTDPGVSHRHAKLFVEAGAIYLLELGSTNGTRLDGVDAHPGVKLPVLTTSSITLGCWTRIELRRR